MKRIFGLLVLLALCAGCGAPAASAPLEAKAKPAEPEYCAAPAFPPEDLPTVMAQPEDVDGTGGYLLIGSVPEADIAFYCDNAETRDRLYIRYGESFEVLEEEPLEDPDRLPEIHWDSAGQTLTVLYSRFGGENEVMYVNGKLVSPAEYQTMTSYTWDGTSWTPWILRSSPALPAVDAGGRL